MSDDPMSSVIESTRTLVADQVALEWAAATKLAEDIERAILAVLPSYNGSFSYRVGVSWSDSAGPKVRVHPRWPATVIVDPEMVERYGGYVAPLRSVEIKTDPDLRPAAGDKVRP